MAWAGKRWIQLVQNRIFVKIGACDVGLRPANALFVYYTGEPTQALPLPEGTVRLRVGVMVQGPCYGLVCPKKEINHRSTTKATQIASGRIAQDLSPPAS